MVTWSIKIPAQRIMTFHYNLNIQAALLLAMLKNLQTDAYLPRPTLKAYGQASKWSFKQL